ncbi:MAG TPA: transposase [Papillibacter sp.]|jgi:transposase|nr:transposase [Papillibacter sp.]
MCRETLRKQLVEYYNEGMSVDQICSEYGVPKSTFYRWIRKSRSEAPKISSDDVNIIITKINELEEEVMTYKKILQLLRHQQAGA